MLQKHNTYGSISSAREEKGSSFLLLRASSVSLPSVWGEISTFSSPKTSATVEKGSSLWGAVLTLSNSAIGAGVLAFPFAFRNCGLVLGLILCLGLSTVLAFGLHACAIACAETGACSFQELVALSSGQTAAVIVEIAMLLYLYGICVGFLVITGDMVEPILQNSFGADLWFAQRDFVVSMVVLLALLPLCMLREITALTYTSAVAIVSVGYMVVMIVTYAFLPHSDAGTGAVDTTMTVAHSNLWPTHNSTGNEAVLFKFDTSIFASLPLFGFALGCHIQAPVIYSELKPSARNVPTMDRVVLVAYSICLCMYIAAGWCGYKTFGENTPQDVLSFTAGPGGPGGMGMLGYPASDPAAGLARVCIMLAVIGCFPVNHFPARMIAFKLWNRVRGRDRGRDLVVGREAARSIAKGALSIPLTDCQLGSVNDLGSKYADADASGVLSKLEMPQAFLVCETVLFVCSAAVVSFFAKGQLATVFDLSSAICGSLEVFFFPGVFWLKWGTGTVHGRWVVAILMGGLGFVIMFCGTYFVLHPAG